MNPIVAALAGIGLSAMLAVAGAALLSLGVGSARTGTDLWIASTGVFEFLLWMFAVTAYFLLHRTLATGPRVVATMAFAAADLLGLIVAFGIALIVLKR